MSKCIYVIDTSSLIKFNPERYPYDIFSSIWGDIENLIGKRRIVTPKLVKEEIRKKNDKLNEWANQNKNMFLDFTKMQAKFIRKIMNTKDFQALVDNKIGVDPVLISVAMEINKKDQKILCPSGKLTDRRAVVVTEEELNGNKVKIPYVCDHFGIECISIFELFRREGWKY